MKKSKKKDVLTLIEGDIVNAKLLNAFGKLGIDADMYYSDSSCVIFRMMKIKEPTDELYESYFEMLRLGDQIDCSDSRKGIRRLAKKIHFLLQRD